MSVVSDSLRADLEQRASHRCEYCHVSTLGQVATFPVDHIQPVSRGGMTVLANLALTCPLCNDHKWSHVEGVDPTTEQTCRLFNPRSDDWHEHFEWSAVELGVLIGKTPYGAGTVARLQINRPLRVATRQVLAQRGLFPEIQATANLSETGELD